MNKRDQLNIRVDPSVLDLIKKAAKAKGQSLTQFVRDASISFAKTNEPIKPEETYYTEGKDAVWFENLSDEDFYQEAEKASMDLADMDTGDLEKYIPFIAIISNAAKRIKKLKSSVNGQQFALSQAWESNSEREIELIILHSLMEKALHYMYNGFEPDNQSKTYYEIEAALALVKKPATHRHTKGHDVRQVAVGKAQVSSIPITEMSTVAIYTHKGEWWVRHQDEFNDGRFKPIEEPNERT